MLNANGKKMRHELRWHWIDPDAPTINTSVESALHADTPRTKRSKIFNLTQDLKSPRIIARANDLDAQEVQLCKAILAAGLKALSPNFRVTLAMLEAFLSAIFEDWRAATLEPKVELLKDLPM